MLQLTLARAQLLHHAALVLCGHVYYNVLHRLHQLAVLFVRQHFRRRNLKLITLAAHGLDEDREVHFAAPHHTEALCGGGILHLQSHVFQKLLVQAVANLARGDELALFARKGAVIHREGHLHRGVVYLHKGQGLHKGRVAQRVADGDIRQAGECHNVAGAGLLHRGAAVGRKAVKRRNAPAPGKVFIMPVTHVNVLAHLYCAVLHPADADAPHELVVINGGAQHGERRAGVTLRRGHIVQNRAEQGHKICARHIGRIASRPGTAGAEHHRAVQLLVCGAKIH